MKHAEIPWLELIVPQVINFSLLLGLLIYFLRKPLRAHFAEKNKKFSDERKKAEDAHVFAEKRNHELKMQLKKLDEESVSALVTAQTESEQLRARLLKETQVSAARLKEDAEKMAQFEFQRAALQVRLELVDKATTMAKVELTKRADKAAQTSLQEAFVENIQGALP